MMVAINNIAFWDMMRCGLMIIYWCFGGKLKKKILPDHMP